MAFHLFVAKTLSCILMLLLTSVDALDRTDTLIGYSETTSTQPLSRSP